MSEIKAAMPIPADPQRCPACHVANLIWERPVGAFVCANQDCAKHHVWNGTSGKFVLSIKASAAGVVAPAVVERYSSMVKLEEAAQRILKTNKVIRCLYRNELPDDCIMADAVLGITGKSLHLGFRDRVPLLQGADRLIVFNGANLIAEFGHGVYLTEGISEVFAHELGHVVRRGFLTEDDRLPVRAESLQRFNELQTTMVPIASTLDVFDEHDLDYWRATTHVVARAFEDGLQFDPCAVHGRYGLDGELYFHLLRDEIVDLFDEPLVDALQGREAPAAFVDQFNDDVAHIRSGN